MKKIIFAMVVAVAAAAIVLPLAGAGSTPGHATGSVDWDYQGTVTGHVSFNANAKTGGSLDYQNSKGQWLHGVVTPGSYKQIGEHSAVFAGMITAGSEDYLPGTGQFYAKVVDGGTSGSNGDQIAVLANDFRGVDAASGDYDMAQGAGIVTGGNLAVH